MDDKYSLYIVLIVAVVAVVSMFSFGNFSNSDNTGGAIAPIERTTVEDRFVIKTVPVQETVSPDKTSRLQSISQEIQSNINNYNSLSTYEKQIFISKAQERKVLMLSLLETNPTMFLQNIIPTSEVNKLPVEIQNNFEKAVIIKGNLGVTIFDDSDNKKNRI